MEWHTTTMAVVFLFVKHSCTKVSVHCEVFNLIAVTNSVNHSKVISFGDRGGTQIGQSVWSRKSVQELPCACSAQFKDPHTKIDIQIERTHERNGTIKLRRAYSSCNVFTGAQFKLSSTTDKRSLCTCKRTHTHTLTHTIYIYIYTYTK